MSKSDNVPVMYPGIPAGFDPMKLLRKAISAKTGEEVFRLGLPYKKLWFRRAHPNGRIRVRPLTITEKIATYEAQVFLNRDDTEPVCSFISSIAVEETKDGQYAQKAKDDAVDNALKNAGFGIQIADESAPQGIRYYGSEIPVSAFGGCVLRSDPIKVSGVKTVVQAPEAPEQTVPASQASTVDSTDDRTTNTARAVLEVLSRNMATTETPPATMVDDSDLPFTVGPSYNNDMTIEDIVKVMTLEQAREVVVDDGLCKNMKLGEVADKRPASLKFYISAGYRKNNNILKAAAQILDAQRQKAS